MNVIEFHAPIKVRKAILADVDAILEDFQGICRASAGWRILADSKDLAREVLDTAIREQFLAVAETGGRLVGFIAAASVAHPLNSALRWTASAFSYAMPGAREFEITSALLGALQEYANAESDWLTISTSAASSFSDDVLEQRGFRLLEKFYVLERACASGVN